MFKEVYPSFCKNTYREIFLPQCPQILFINRPKDVTQKVWPCHVYIRASQVWLQFVFHITAEKPCFPQWLPNAIPPPPPTEQFSVCFHSWLTVSNEHYPQSWSKSCQNMYYKKCLQGCLIEKLCRTSSEKFQPLMGMCKTKELIANKVQWGSQPTAISYSGQIVGFLLFCLGFFQPFPRFVV